MAENACPVAAEPPNTSSGLSEEKQKEFLAKLRTLAIWQVVLGVSVGIIAIAAVIYSMVYAGFCIYKVGLGYSFEFKYNCIRQHYPSFGVGVWSSIMTVVAGGLGLCSTSSNNVPKCTITVHIVLAICGIVAEFLSSVTACIICTRRTYAFEDSAYYGMMIVIAVSGFVKMFLLAMSVRQSFLLIPNCCNDCAGQMRPPHANVIYIPTSGVQQQGGYSYAPTGMQPQGTMVMTPQGTVMMQPGMMQPGMMAPQTTVTTQATAPPSAAPGAMSAYPTQPPTYQSQPACTVSLVEEKKPIG